MDRKPIIAIPVGDPAGIGPEISLKAALDANVCAIARPVLVGDPAIIAEVCNARRIMLTALVIDPSNLPEAQLLRTMAPLRAHASMLVVAKGEEYVDAMLTALRA